ncbi:MAG: hypothetical protein WC791_00560 [Candidatus Paceibacterota bacterium]|jgi:hypothetical protein
MNVNKIIITSSVLIFALSASYFFVFYLPANQNAQNLVLRKADCAQRGKDALSRYKQEASKNISNSTQDFSSHYNTKLQKCFVEITDILADKNFLSTSVTIYDGLENKQMAWFVTTSSGLGKGTKEYGVVDINGNNTDITQEQFETLERQYMSE